MGLIISDSINKFIVGYPTVSDKYNVAGATLTGSNELSFGSIVKYSDTAGYFEAVGSADTLTSISQVAGICLATNVKLVDYFDQTATVKPGEAFNITLPGTYIAVKLASTAVEADIKAAAEVRIKLAGGEFTTSTDATGTAWSAAVFTGTYEKQGDDLVAEIYIK